MSIISHGIKYVYAALALVFILVVSFQFISIGRDADSAVEGYLTTQSLIESKIPTNTKQNFEEEKAKAKEEVTTPTLSIPAGDGKTEIYNGTIVGTWPVDPKAPIQQKITSILGAVDHPLHASGHSGTDVAYGAGSVGDKKVKILAITGGTVKSVTRQSGYGKVFGYGVNVVIEEPTTGIQFLYGHMQNGSVPDDVKVGAVVKEGQNVGIMGTTGSSSGIHLHVSVIRNPGVKYQMDIPVVKGKQLNMLAPKILLFKRETLPASGINFTADGPPIPIPVKP